MIAAGNFLQQLPAQPGVGVVPIMAATAAPAMVVPYMYIPQPGHAPAGLVQIAAPQQPVVYRPHPRRLPSQQRRHSRHHSQHYSHTTLSLRRNPRHLLGL